MGVLEPISASAEHKYSSFLLFMDIVAVSCHVLLFSYSSFFSLKPPGPLMHGFKYFIFVRFIAVSFGHPASAQIENLWFLVTENKISAITDSNFHVHKLQSISLWTNSK